MKSLIITEKPSVAQAFAKALNVARTTKTDGYIEDDKWVITWCVGHLVTMSLPEAYDEKYKVWSLNDLPFIPQKYKYEIIKDVAKQFQICKSLLNRNDISTIYNCGDSAREGEYIQRLLLQEAKVNPNASLKRVWIDSQTDDEILKGIKYAKPMSEYDNLAKAGYMRAKEDYLIGMNYSRLYTMLFGKTIKDALGLEKFYISIGRVMTCVLGMIVTREREIQNHTITPYFGFKGNIGDLSFSWKADDTSSFKDSDMLYSENGFKDRANAEKLLACFNSVGKLNVTSIEHKDEKKYAPLLFNLAELQSECTKLFKISPKQTLDIAQKLYEGKRITYPRTDARVLSTAICKEISKILNGLSNSNALYGQMIAPIIKNNVFSGIADTKYCDDSKISDHYAIIPTGQNDKSVTYTEIEEKVYDLIARRFIAIFYPCAVYDKCTVIAKCGKEPFYLNLSGVKSKGFLVISNGYNKENDKSEVIKKADLLIKGNTYDASFEIHEMETKPPTRYTSGSMILAMENAGKLIEEELREQLKGCGIGTSATRGDIINKLAKIGYININKNTQILTPTNAGNEIVKCVEVTIPSLLSPKMTANWEKGLEEISKGNLPDTVYYDKLVETITKEVNTLIQNKPEISPVKADKNNARSLVCPLCNKGQIRQNQKAYYCTEYKNGCKFTIWNTFAGKTLSDKNVYDLVTSGKTSKIKFKKKDGTEYTASLMLENGEVKFAPWKKDK